MGGQGVNCKLSPGGVGAHEMRVTGTDAKVHGAVGLASHGFFQQQLLCYLLRAVGGVELQEPPRKRIPGALRIGGVCVLVFFLFFGEFFGFWFVGGLTKVIRWVLGGLGLLVCGCVRFRVCFSFG